MTSQQGQVRSRCQPWIPLNDGGLGAPKETSEIAAVHPSYSLKATARSHQNGRQTLSSKARRHDREEIKPFKLSNSNIK